LVGGGSEDLPPVVFLWAPSIELGLDDLDLLKEKRLAGVGLDRLGDAVLGRAAFDDVGDVDFFALEARRGDQVVK